MHDGTAQINCVFEFPTAQGLVPGAAGNFMDTAFSTVATPRTPGWHAAAEAVPAHFVHAPAAVASACKHLPQHTILRRGVREYTLRVENVHLVPVVAVCRWASALFRYNEMHNRHHHTGRHNLTHRITPRLIGFFCL